MNSQARASVQLFVANVTLKMLCFLMLNEDLLVIKVSIAIPAPWLHLLLLFSSHLSMNTEKEVVQHNIPVLLSV